MLFSEILLKYSKDSGPTVYVDTFKSQFGTVVAAADEDYLYIVTFEDSKKLEVKFHILSEEMQCKYIQKRNKVLENLQCEFADYFEGKLKKFTVPIKTFGSEFQKGVWNKLQDIPYASTQTYGDLAKAMGRQASHARAVGAACGSNAHLLVIPCHRIVAANSKGGFSSGIDRKEWLLDHEQKHVM